MELKVLEERPNPLLKRTEYRFEITHTSAATPSREEVRAELSKQLRVPKDRLVVERMHARYGAPRSRGEAMAYLDAKVVLTVVRSHILVRNKLQEKESATAAPAPAAPPDAAPAKEEAAPKSKGHEPAADATPEPKAAPAAKGKTAPAAAAGAKSTGKPVKPAPAAAKE